MSSESVIRTAGQRLGLHRWQLILGEEWRRDNSPSAVRVVYARNGSIIRAHYQANPSSDVFPLHGRSDVVGALRDLAG